MTDISQFRTALGKSALESYDAEYKRLDDTWKQLEGKAQGVIAASGVFAGFVLAFAREFKPETPRPLVWLAALAIALLLGGVAIAAVALRIRSLVGAPSGGSIEAMASDLLALPDNELEERRAPFLEDQMRLWRSSISALREANKRKAERVAKAQVTMLLAIATVATLAMLAILFNARVLQ